MKSLRSAPKAIVAFLTSKENTTLPFCDDCLHDIESIDQRQVATITETLALTCEYTKLHGVCTYCARERRVTARRGRRKRLPQSK